MDSIMEFLGWTVFYYFIFKMAQTFAQSLIDNNHLIFLINNIMQRPMMEKLIPYARYQEYLIYHKKTMG